MFDHASIATAVADAQPMWVEESMMTRLRGRQRWLSPRTWSSRRKAITAAVLVLAVAFTPVPWLHAVSDQPAGWTWRLDGRLVVQGEVMQPPGRWSWLTVGRPPFLIEVARDRLIGTEQPARDMRIAPPGSQPLMVEPVAAAVGLRHAGADLQLGLVVEAFGPLRDDLPAHAIIVAIDGVELRSRADWIAASQGIGETVTFRTDDGASYSARGPALPYERIRVVDLGPEAFEAAIGGVGRLSRLKVVEWFRSLSLGNSHGMMVALVTYAHYADIDLARGRHIAGTGGIIGDGTVTRISGLAAKARAARRAGADVMFFPASQAEELTDFDARGMQLVAINNLAEAIAWLQAPVIGLAAHRDASGVLIDQVEQVVSVAFQLGGTDPWTGSEFTQVRRAPSRDHVQVPVVEDEVGGHSGRPSDVGTPVA